MPVGDIDVCALAALSKRHHQPLIARRFTSCTCTHTTSHGYIPPFFPHIMKREIIMKKKEIMNRDSSAEFFLFEK